MSEKIKELSEFDQCLASLETSVKELKGCMGGDDPKMNEKMGALADNLYASMASLRNYVYDVHDRHNKKMNDHMDPSKHAPAFKSKKHLENFIKACDMGSDYSVSPTEIATSSYANMSYASTIKVDKKGMRVDVDFTKPKEKKI
jgi:hypothetical protein